MASITREDCLARDERDPLAGLRERFVLPEGVIYLDGNSLGALPAHTPAAIARVVEQEWGQGLIRSWNEAGWFDKPRTLGDRVGRLVGAAPGQVVVGDTTSVNVFKAVTAAMGLRPGRRAIVGDADNFPTDLYVVQGATALVGGHELRLVSTGGPTLDDVLDDDVAAVLLTEVDYRTGARYDLAEVTRRVHDAGALMIWDLCHSVGALPVELDAHDVDLAVGCTYKYVNGGPGSPAFVYVNRRLHGDIRQPLTGWHGHARPFEFGPDYEPHEGITRFVVGTPHLLSFAGLEAALDVWDDVDPGQLREKSLALTDLFIDLADERLDDRFAVATPRDHARRGSQVALRAEHGYAMMQALIDRGVIGDFRAPDIMRFGFAPLYIGFADVFDAVQALVDVVEGEAWRDERYAVRNAVT